MAIKLPLFLAVGLSVYMSLAHAQLIEYTYTGHNLNPTYSRDYNYNERVTIDFTIDDSLISPSGHFSETIDYKYFPSNVVSPFQSFLISDGRGRYEINDAEDPESPAYFIFVHKTINVTFDTDQQGNINNWNISGEFHSLKYLDDFLKIESIFDGGILPQQDLVSDKFINGPVDSDGSPFTEIIKGNTVPGTWTRTVVPLPGSLVLFGSGLLAFLFRKPKGFVAIF
jgi:hypothetical protein